MSVAYSGRKSVSAVRPMTATARTSRGITSIPNGASVNSTTRLASSRSVYGITARLITVDGRQTSFGLSKIQAGTEQPSESVVDFVGSETA